MYFSTAFDTADYTVLLNPLQEWVHVDARVDFYQSYLFIEAILFPLKMFIVLCHQGYICSFIHFGLYVLPLGYTIQNCNSHTLMKTCIKR